MNDNVLANQIAHHAVNIRRNIIKMISQAGSGHPAGALGLTDIVATLYFAVMNYKPGQPDRDLFILSNGHTCPVIYATFAELGLISNKELTTFRQFNSRLQGHPERIVLPYLETTSGPLGEGLSQAAGMAYALKYLEQPSKRRIYCVVGDGELNEGQCWEAIMWIAKYNLDNLTMIIDCNDIQLSGSTKDIMPINNLNSLISQFGWSAYDMDNQTAHDPSLLISFFDNLNQRIDSNLEHQPTVIVAHTTAGKGVSFMENDFHWHGKTPSVEQMKQALLELDQAERSLDGC